MIRLVAFLAALLIFTAPLSAETTAVTGTKGSPGASQKNVTAPSGTTSTAVFVQMGLAGTVTPTESGTVLVIISGDIAQSTTADGANWLISYGTGAAPSNGGAASGTITCGPTQGMTFLTGVLKVPFSINCVVSGLTLGTAYWIDLQFEAVTGGTATASNVGVSVHELR